MPAIGRLRSAIIDVLERADGPLSLVEVLERVRERFPKTTYETINTTVGRLAEAGMVAVEEGKGFDRLCWRTPTGEKRSGIPSVTRLIINRSAHSSAEGWVPVSVPRVRWLEEPAQ